jgi:putative methyltransferase (TIGR04325 family)
MKNVFEGIYKKVDKLSSLSTETLDVKQWKKIVFKKICINFKKNTFFLVSSPLLILLSLVFQKKRKIRILDIGSGGLDTYFDILHNHNLKNFFSIDTIELPSVISVYKKFSFTNKKIDIKFFTEIKKKKYDVIHISDSLQYMESPKEIINEILSMNGSYIVLNNTRLGNFNTYATLQNFYEHKIPTWFFSKNIKKLFSKKYLLILESEFLPKFYGSYSSYPMKNFPKKFRIKNSKTMIFKLKSKAI